MKIKPLGPRCVVVRIVPEQGPGKIILPDSVKEKHRWGRVVAVGGDDERGAEIRKRPVKLGDEVLLPKHIADSFEEEGEEYLVLEYRELLAVR